MREILWGEAGEEEEEEVGCEGRRRGAIGCAGKKEGSGYESCKWRKRNDRKKERKKNKEGMRKRIKEKGRRKEDVRNRRKNEWIGLLPSKVVINLTKKVYYFIYQFSIFLSIPIHFGLSLYLGLSVHPSIHIYSSTFLFTCLYRYVILLLSGLVRSRSQRKSHVECVNEAEWRWLGRIKGL